MSKEYNSGFSLQQKILQGVDILADNVVSTLGPRGRNVILHGAGNNPIVTKDGVTVANFIDLDDPFQNVGAQIVKQAAEQTAVKAGDGTTTSIVLSREILKKAQKFLTSGSSPIELKRGMEKAVEAIVEELQRKATPIRNKEDVEHIATISANGDATIGNLIATAIDVVGKDGAITIEEARSLETSLDVVEGFRFDSGYVSPQFITDERRSAVRYEDALVMVTDAKLESVDELLPILEVVAREGRPFVIVAEDITGQALAALIMNAIRGTMKVAAIKAPRYGEERREILKDLCISIGATFVTRETGLKIQDTKLEHLGNVKTIEVLNRSTTMVCSNENGEEIEQRIETLKGLLASSGSTHESERLQERITRLASGIAIIRVGAATEVEMIEKKHRIEDALEAVKSAQLEGVVSGGGTALVRAAGVLLNLDVDNDDQEFGVRIISAAVSAPLKQMAKNANQSPDVILHKLNEEAGNIGFNFSTGEYVNMLQDGIIDPVKVTCTALQNAYSVSSMILTADYAIVDLV